MLKRQHNICLLLCLWMLLRLFTGVCFAEENKLDRLAIRAESFDYSTAKDWGFPDPQFYYNDLYDDHPIEYPIEYVGMSPEQQAELSAHPENWYKGWIRLRILPGVDFGSSEGYYRNDMISSYYADMGIDNVEIANADEIGIYPKPFMKFAANPAAFFDETKCAEETGGDLWYMEVLIKADGRTEAEITEALQRAEVYCDVLFFGKEQIYEKQKVSISLAAVERCVHYEENTFRIQATQIKPSDEDVYYIFSNYDIDDAIWEEVCNTPELFSCYEIQLNMTNDGTYDIVDTADSSKQTSENVWLLRYELEPVMLNGCKSKTSGPLTHYFLIIRENRFSESEITSLPLRMEVYTEFAGINNESEPHEGVMGSFGIPFPVEIDMSSCVFATE